MVSRRKIEEFERQIAEARAEVASAEPGSEAWEQAYAGLTSLKTANREYQSGADFTVDEDAAEGGDDGSDHD